MFVIVFVLGSFFKFLVLLWGFFIGFGLRFCFLKVYVVKRRENLVWVVV